jgi:predicted membrane-bound spermidine synthase
MKVTKPYLYFLSFLEGGSVMACELIGAKMLAPYFGTSLYVWAAALGLTLGGLMTGYFLGGIASRIFRNNLRTLYVLLVLAAIFLFLMPFTSGWIMDRTIHLNLQTGAMLSLLVFMFPPLIFMGMVSPVIINILTEEAKSAGNSAGNVYAISTLGGILVTFLFGFYIIPAFGISKPAMIGGILLGILPALSLLRAYSFGGVAAIVLMVVGLFAFNPVDMQENDIEIHYHSEGVLGQVKVLDFPMQDQANPGRRGRALVVNNTLQTVMDIQDPDYNYWGYTHYLPVLAESYPQGSEVLLMGMGGGTLVKRLEKLNFEMDIVEIDRRIKEVAHDYFDLSEDHNIIVDDARHFMKITPKKYDILIFDVFKGESAPEHVLTLEGLQDARRILKPGGMVLINFYGYLDGSIGKVTRSIYKTMLKDSFNVQIFATPGEPDSRNLILVGRTGVLNENYTFVQEEKRTTGLPFFLHPSVVDTADAVVLTDEKPQLQLFARAARQWRILYNQLHTKDFSHLRKY